MRIARLAPTLMGLHLSASLDSVGSYDGDEWFAPLIALETSRFFTAKASLDDVLLLQAFALGDSPHLSAGRAQLVSTI